MPNKNDCKMLAILFAIPLLVCLIAAGCTLSFQNISTHGVATDLVDEDLSPEITTDTKANIP